MAEPFGFCEDDIWEKRKEVFQLLSDPAQGMQNWVDWASQDHHSLEILVDLLEQITADLIRWSTLVPLGNQDFHWIHSDFQTELRDHVQLLSRQLGSLGAARLFWLAQAERLAKMRQDLLAPLNRKLLVQDLLLPWVGVLATSSKPPLKGNF